MLHVYDFMTLPFEPVLYRANSLPYVIVNVSLVLPSLDGPIYDLYGIFFVEFVNVPRSLLRPQRTSKDAPATPRGAPKASQGPFRDPRDLPRTLKAGNLKKFFVDLAGCHQIISSLGSRAGVIYCFF